MPYDIDGNYHDGEVEEGKWYHGVIGVVFYITGWVMLQLLNLVVGLQIDAVDYFNSKRDKEMFKKKEM